MPLQQDLGTLKDESIADRWALAHTLGNFANYQTLSGSFQQTDLDGPGLFKRPFYFKFKCMTESLADRFALAYQSGAQSYGISIERTFIQAGGIGPSHNVDMTIPHVLEIYVPETDIEDGEGYVDGVKVFDIPPEVYVTTERLRFATESGSTDLFLLYYYQITRKPFTLIDRLWLEHLRARVQDPADRDDPSNFIVKRYPVSSFPTEILEPRIDFHIAHRIRSKIHPSFVHAHFDSSIRINFYIQVDTAVQGETNVDALNLLASNIIEGLEYSMDDISPLKSYVVSQPEYKLDGRNNVWVGNITVNGEHLLEVF